MEDKNMSITRRKSALMSTILGMESSDALKEDASTAIDALDEQIPEELGEDDLSFLDETPEDVDASEDDPEFNIEDIVGCADSNGRVKMSSIKALAEEALIPDDLDDDEIVGSEDDLISESEDDITASLDAPGIEDTVGDDLSGGDPSLSQIVDMDENTRIDEKEQNSTIEKITASLDRLANYCERSGHKRLAYKLDLISNTIDKNH